MKKTALVLTVLVFIGFALSAQEQVHLLQRGETIYTLARRYGVDAAFLIRFNEIQDATRLPVGAEIRIPGTYRVEEGEYIYSIARDLGVDWLELLRVNNLDRDDVLRPGDVLLIPGGGAEAEVAAERDVGEAGRDDTLTADARETSESDNSNMLVADPPPAGEGSSDNGERYEWPLPGLREPWDGRFRGIVMTGQAGDSFHSVTTGVVSFVGPFTSFGKLILVRSENGYLYGYAGADRVDVAQGDHVRNGTVLGSVGVSPAFNSARVLFTVWRDNRYIDPESAPRG